MPQLMTKKEALAYCKRWQRVKAIEIAELRSRSMDLKWKQFNTLLKWAKQLGWSESLRQGEAEVWARWARLRKANRG